MDGVVFIVGHVEFIEHIKMVESILNDWQISSNVLRRKCVVKDVKF